MWGYGRQSIDMADVTTLNSKDSHRHGDGLIMHELGEAYYAGKFGLSNSTNNYLNAHNSGGIVAENAFLKNTGGGVRGVNAAPGNYGTHTIVPGI